MRKIIILIIFYLISGIARGQSASVTIDHYIEYPGSVQIPLEVTGFSNVASISIYFQYDPAVLSFNGYQGGALPGMEANAFVENNIPQVGITWSASGSSGLNVPNGNLITILFTYNAGSSDFSFIENKCEVVDNDYNNIPVLYVDGRIDPKGIAYVEIPDVINQTPNTNINIPVNADFSEIIDGVSSFTFIVDFIPDVVSYQSIINVNPLLLGGVTVDLLSSSRISLTWLNAGTNGIQGTGEFKLFDITMSYTVGSSTLNFYQAMSSVGDNNGMDVNVSYTDGTLSQNPATIASVTAGKVTVPTSSATVDVPVNVDFSGISNGVSSFNFVIGFDDDVLQYQSVINPALSPVVVEVISSSRISVSWLNPGSTGSILSGKLLDIRFNFSGGNSDITFITASCEMGDNNMLDVNASYTDGWVRQDPATIIQVIAGTQIANAGTSVDVPVTVQNFKNIGSFDFYILFDPANLTFSQIANVNADIGTANLEYNIIGTNQIGINWYTSSSVTLADGAKLFDLRFDFTGGQSDLTFDLASCEVANNGAITQYVQYTNGAVSEDMPLDINVKAADVLAQPGAINVPLTANGYDNIGAFDFTISFDVSKLTFTGLNNVFPNLNDDGELIYNAVGNQIFIAWNIDQAALSGFTLSDGETLFDLGFSYLGGESDINFDIENSTVSDFFLDILDVSFLSGSVKGGIDVELTVFLEGLFNTGTGQMNKAKDYLSGSVVDKYEGNIADLITVELHDAGAYGTTVYSVENVELLQNGKASFSIPIEYHSNYYITIESRNHIETVSGTPVSFLGLNVAYDFTSGATKAFGSNMKELNTGVWTIYVGDINKDGTINSTDRSLANGDAIAIRQGYLITDVNGDGTINGTDRSMVHSNVIRIIISSLP